MQFLSRHLFGWKTHIRETFKVFQRLDCMRHVAYGVRLLCAKKVWQGGQRIGPVKALMIAIPISNFLNARKASGTRGRSHPVFLGLTGVTSGEILFS
jgi:hypothetical protein